MRFQYCGEGSRDTGHRPEEGADGRQSPVRGRHLGWWSERKPCDMPGFLCWLSSQGLLGFRSCLSWWRLAKNNRFWTGMCTQTRCQRGAGLRSHQHHQRGGIAHQGQIHGDGNGSALQKLVGLTAIMTNITFGGGGVKRRGFAQQQRNIKVSQVFQDV